MNSGIDILQLIPKKTSSGYDIIIKHLFKNNHEYLHLSYKHPRARPVKIRRFADSAILGSLLGQYQAEGTKDAKKKFRVEFTNKNILEHKEFAESLLYLGVSKKVINGEYFYRDDFNKNLCSEFEKTVGVHINIIQKSKGMKGRYGFRTYVRSVLLIEILLNILHNIRNSIQKQNKALVDAFFAKLLTGDGTLDIRVKGRAYGYPCAKIKITDRNSEYLRDYGNMMHLLGFKPKINYRHICVRSSCSFEKMLYLYRINAFKNTINWNKMVILIGMLLQGRRYSTYYKFLDLKKLNSFTSTDLMKIYKSPRRTINSWLNNKEAECLIRGERNPPYHVKWKVTNRGKDLIDILLSWKEEFDALVLKSKTSELSKILESMKVRSNASTKERAYLGPS